MNKNCYLYKYHGLKVESEILLPELKDTRFEGSADIKIALGKVPEHLEGKDIFRREGREASKDIFLFKPTLDIPVGRFLVKNGTSITAEAFPNGNFNFLKHLCSDSSIL